MIYTEAFFKSLSSDFCEAILEISKEFTKYKEEFHKTTIKESMEVYYALEALIIKHGREQRYPLPELNGDNNNKAQIIDNWKSKLYRYASEEIGKRNEQDEFESIRRRIQSNLNLVFSYNFTDGDLIIIKDSLKELKEKVKTSQALDDAHKKRVLKKIEEVEKELKKKMTNFDKLFGVLVEVQLFAKRVDTEIKPWVNLTKLILQIVGRTMSSALELPSGTTFTMLNDESNTDI